MSELDIYKKQGFGKSSGYGSKPALVIVDFVNGFNDAGQFGGGNIAAAIDRTAVLLARMRKLKLPVAYTRVVYADDGSDARVVAAAVPARRQALQHLMRVEIGERRRQLQLQLRLVRHASPSSPYFAAET